MEPIVIKDGRRVVLVHIDHDDVLDPQPHSKIYDAVVDCIAKHKRKSDEFIEKIFHNMYDGKIEKISDEKKDDIEPYWENGFFQGDDARSLYSIISTFKPRNYLEVGSGNSTKFARRAISDCGGSTKIISIDPQPRAEIDKICDTVIRSSATRVDLSVFAKLEAGDVLFWDGSHLVLNGADTVRFFLEILPIVKPGVLVHVHDINLPWEYTPAFDGRGYAEQYMLATALINNDNLCTLFPVTKLKRDGVLREGGTSFWFKKLAA